MNSLRDKIITNHKEEYYDNAKMVSFRDKTQSGLVYYSLDELKDLSGDYYPLCCYRDEVTKKLMYGMSDNIIHTYVEGETGIGKTTRVIMQSIKALSTLKSKPSMVVVDPYGEIFENQYLSLIDNGYTIKVLNCDNPSRSDTYNPFYALGKIVLKENKLTHEVLNQIRKISEVIMPPDQNTKDPIWEQGACSYINGLIIDAFEDLLAGHITIEELTLYNIIQRHFWLRKELFDTGERNIFRIPHYANKGHTTLCVQKLMSVTNNADRTRDSYFGVAENGLDKFGQVSVYQLSSNNSIDLEEFIEKPTVIFVQSGETIVGDHLVSFLISDLYTLSVKLGKENYNKRLKRDIHLFLDEFANYSFGTGDEYIRMLTTSRKFGLHWHMYLQCDAQLDKKFNNKQIGDIIRANATEIFMGSLDYATVERFSNSCGKQTIESISSQIYQKDLKLETVPLITPDKLLTTEIGYMYIKVSKKPLLYTYFEPFYTCSEFVRWENIYGIYPFNCFDYKKTRRLPSEYQKEKRNSNPFFDRRLTHDELLMFDAIRYNLKWVQIDENKKILVVDAQESDMDDITFKNYFKINSLEELNHTYPLKDDYSNKKVKITINEELEQKIKTIRNKATYKKSLEKYTCIPKFIFDKLFKNIEIDIDENNIHFEVIETFISNHDFVSALDWIDNLEFELDDLVSKDLLTPICYKAIKEALESLSDLSYDEIMEIKKMIRG